MAKTADAPPVLERKASVIAGHGMRDVPEGTAGKVLLVNGLSWIRYWVDFDNGVSMGSVNRRNIFTPAEWKLRQERGDDETDEAGDGEGDAAAGDADADGGLSVNGVLVPQLLIDRAKAARERLSA